MAHVVTKPCVGCRYTDCVVVCPVECFYEGENMLYIHPDECIDCEACVAECPVEAIFHEDNVPDEWKDYIELNAKESLKSKVITEKKKPLADS
ncbi:MAG: 4Fe-4S dicluster domain-containing protein [Planctomycetota bacterium]|jgi:ferredoxin